LKLQKSLVIPLVLIFGTLIILLSIVQQSTTFAQTTESTNITTESTEPEADTTTESTKSTKSTKSTTDDPITTKSVNDVSMRVVFNFRAGVEEATTFEVFKFLAGFDKTTPPKFQLVGIVNGNTPLLHNAVHERFHNPAQITQYSDFDIEIYLTDKYSLNVVNRFGNCNINDFFIDVLYDKNKTWQGVSEFAWLETFEFECAGAHPLHPADIWEAPGESSEEAITNKEPEEKESLTWENFYP